MQAFNWKISGCICVMLGLGNLSFTQQLAHPVAVSSNSGSLKGTQPDIRAWTDPALNHNKLIQQQTPDGAYKLIGIYKVIGTCFLFGENLKANMFATDAKAYNIFISYNTYDQGVEFYSTSNPDKPLMREPGTVDSFIIHENVPLGITSSLKFVYGSLLGAKDKYYFQEVYKGDKFSLYKRYKSELGYCSTNLAQTELRQFDLQVEYYYTRSENKGIRRIKPNAAGVIKEFKDIKDLSTTVSAYDFTTNPEAAFHMVFDLLNQ